MVNCGQCRRSATSILNLSMSFQLRKTLWTVALLIAASCQLAAGPSAQNTEVDRSVAKSNSSCPVVVCAVWYKVPPASLARRRAKTDEMTAAHNRLPLGTLVRVTRLSTGDSLVVRITDRGITNKYAKIDL